MRFRFPLPSKLQMRMWRPRIWVPRMPRLCLPRIKWPHVCWPKFHCPKVQMPKIVLPKLVLPRVTLPKVKVPRFKAPKIQWPRLSVPRIKMPSIKLPSIAMPKIQLPRVHVPKMTFSLPSVQFPTLKLPTFKTPAIRLPSIKIPTIKFPSMTLPSINMYYLKNAALTFVWICIIVGIGGGVWASGLHPLDLIKKANFRISQEPMVQTASLDAESLNAIAPASGIEATMDNSRVDHGRYALEESVLNVEAVLIPRENTVISSSTDSKIKSINFDNGELFRKGDILVEYVCKSAQAEVDIARIQQDLAQQKSMSSYKLFKLDIISDLEKQELETENRQAEARTGLYESRMENCFIRAEYDGRVIKRLANSGEFTRTDRVLMEVASLDYLKAEFLLPSRWLRWVNVGAPVEINISETDRSYKAEIKYIYGEVDPVSQSIQVTAQLEPYNDPLLPGMSGKVVIDAEAIRRGGIYGFLEKTPVNHRR